MTFPYPDNPGQTHYDGCWREPGHHNCAVAEVERLQGLFAYWRAFATTLSNGEDRVAAAIAGDKAMKAAQEARHD